MIDALFTGLAWLLLGLTYLAAVLCCFGIMIFLGFLWLVVSAIKAKDSLRKR